MDSKIKIHEPAPSRILQFNCFSILEVRSRWRRCGFFRLVTRAMLPDWQKAVLRATSEPELWRHYITSTLKALGTLPSSPKDIIKITECGAANLMKVSEAVEASVAGFGQILNFISLQLALKYFRRDFDHNL